MTESSIELRPTIRIEGARQNNLKGVTVELPLGQFIVVTGVSGSGKSSFAFDTVYAEGQRRYVETFSPYARQFLERMDRPRVDRIEGIPPAIAIDQTNPVRTSRSTVGTMTELNDYLKLLFARAARLFCEGCGRPVQRETAESIAAAVLRSTAREETLVLITFSVPIPRNFSPNEVRDVLWRQGYERIYSSDRKTIEVVQDRIRLVSERRRRLVESLESALRGGHGRVTVRWLDAQEKERRAQRFSTALHCAECDRTYRDPTPNLFSFNSPLGACPTCRGFGRTIGIDYGLVVPDESLTLAQGAIRPWQSESYRECQEDLCRFARRRGIPLDVPWRDLTADQKEWVLEGEGRWENGCWYGVRRFFDWLQSKSYRMHIRVLLSRYRSYQPCPVCGGGRLQPEALLWRIGDASATAAAGLGESVSSVGRPPGLTFPEVTCLSITQVQAFFEAIRFSPPLDAAVDVLLREIRTRLRYLVEIGLGYLTLDRQSRTLSGGEAQRINLTTALGTSLVNTLFVLDEPSIGLHPRDIHRLITVLHQLRDAGNTVLVVEHDPHVIAAADQILDFGPGPGECGGHLIFSGPLQKLLACPRSRTADYLAGRRRVDAGMMRLPPPAEGDLVLQILDAAEHNLKGIDVTIPLRRLVCISGVSGSGKSTLVQDILYPALRKLKGQSADPPGRHRAIVGHEHISEVVLVDQAPIGRTSRSNPASYVGAFDAIRARFSQAPLARQRGYTAGTFSFNAGAGRCPTCRGSGFEHVEMQFISDVYLRCPDCDGRRYRREVLEVKVSVPPHNLGERPSARQREVSIAEVLDLTVEEALEAFAPWPDVTQRLEVLRDVGLGYLRLGQPVPTLSGGEAQRLKLAGHLVAVSGGLHGSYAGRPGVLFLMDEPTTGLHLDDVAVLLRALRRLVTAGHTVVVIEHHLDVIAAADWIIDLGPEGGEAGGEIVCAGPVETVRNCARSYTGAALRSVLQGVSAVPAAQQPVPSERGARSCEQTIQIRGAHEHNLKHITVEIPRGRLTVITGVSGSGKSTVAFDILFAEGQRRYLESLNAYARQFVEPVARPAVDAVSGIPPTVAIEQRTSQGGWKSTVGTVTEIYHFLRLLFARLGVQHCPECGVPVEAQTPEAVIARVMRGFRGRTVRLLAPLVVARKGYYTELARRMARRGFRYLWVDGRRVPTAAWPRLDRFREHTIELPFPELRVRPKEEALLREQLTEALTYGKGRVYVEAVPMRDGKGAGRGRLLFSTRRACVQCERSFDELDPRLFSYNSPHGWCPQCEGTGVRLPEPLGAPEAVEGLTADFLSQVSVCSSCRGRRLRPEALAVRFQDRSIAELTASTVEEVDQYFSALRLHGREAAIARDVIAEIRSRLAFLKAVGLSYLTLDRSAPTLSSGEARRIRLAAQLGSNLRGVCYILDEPTIGLHPRDNRRLLKILRQLCEKGNTVVVVEHDEETIRGADHIIDLGPGGGVHGGRIVVAGQLRDVLRHPQSLTGQFLRNRVHHPLRGRRRAIKGRPRIEVKRATLHNLRDQDVAIPIGCLVCVTGVSGSGKSTLARDILYANLCRRTKPKRSGLPFVWTGCREIRGAERVRRVLEVDQSPIGKTPRSCPGTYVGFWDEIRRLFAEAPEARMRGYTASRFSFNVPGGRCEVCEGQGVRRVEMTFLPDVTVPCEACHGTRFAAETLAIRYRGRTVADVLSMSVEEAADFFSAHQRIQRPLELLRDVGLGYLTLGQPSPTLSGGEAQRIKLVAELASARTNEEALGRGKEGLPDVHDECPGSCGSLYLLDEPTIGLHMADVERLVRVLHRLVDAGHTVVVIEHNLDVIAEADWILDLGPEGGSRGGRLVAEGTPEDLAATPRRSYTCAFLHEFLSC